mgnify:CR=1 FL=1
MKIHVYRLSFVSWLIYACCIVWIGAYCHDIYTCSVDVAMTTETIIICILTLFHLIENILHKKQILKTDLLYFLSLLSFALFAIWKRLVE